MKIKDFSWTHQRLGINYHVKIWRDRYIQRSGVTAKICLRGNKAVGAINWWEHTMVILTTFWKPCMHYHVNKSFQGAVVLQEP